MQEAYREFNPPPTEKQLYYKRIRALLDKPDGECEYADAIKSLFNSGRIDYRKLEKIVRRHPSPASPELINLSTSFNKIEKLQDTLFNIGAASAFIGPAAMCGGLFYPVISGNDNPTSEKVAVALFGLNVLTILSCIAVGEVKNVTKNRIVSRLVYG